LKRFKKTIRLSENQVIPKKFFGQHFLKDHCLAEKIVNCLSNHPCCDRIVEIGPGMGILSQYLEKKFGSKLLLIELDYESVRYIQKKFPNLKESIIHGDFLKVPLFSNPNEQIALIGNIPYNVSSQILFKLFEHKNQIKEAVFMVQKEVALRLTSSAGNKSYGLLSVLLQTYYDIEYMFTVNEDVFYPRPKVKSAVVKISRNTNQGLPFSDEHYKKIVKQAFSMRRKTLRNALKPLNLSLEKIEPSILEKRAEQLTVDDFIVLAQNFLTL
jgi:16S rRNA (adenine1518-N6/adenine1519-N6)-dimethyltransferase